MLDTDTKRRIDTARDILVGKVPDPKSQVEQITIALIYKFMDDMDAEAEELGGKRKFFTKEFARYGWAKLMSPSLGGHEMRDLYKEGLAKMPENPGIPPLFRDILKDADLPYRDPETLKSFLKIINEFTYDHSEKLGDAFEYLLSVLGSQGDAGQFRTPRHIIDFMVEVIAPKKGEVILDPACGTAGFLISAWKHILANNSSKPKPSPQPSPTGRGSHSYRGGFDFAGLKDRARELRKKQTDAEALLWDLLRDRQLCDSKFRRQHQFGDYICDFYCHEANLVVECDGEVHDSPDQKKHDQKRDAYLKSQGLKVIRFQNNRVLNDTPAVLEEIATLLPSLSSSPSSSPSGRGGGEGSPGAMPGDLLTPDERGRLSASIRGYDISPDMVRLSLVNLYLHGFADPHIVEYDTLTSEERWNEYADVILANPPFMSPKGGIKPHKRFSIQAKRSEVLFVDYMAEHLTPTGRAAIIVPEGIIFQSQTAYKQLRKMLVENSLVAVVSLPAGCFNPYSGVKTSILILDKALAKKSDTIAFLKIENDGYGLGAQRRAVAGSDLPDAAAFLKDWMSGGANSPSEPLCGSGDGSAGGVALPSAAQIVPKSKISANGDYNLSGERYREGDQRSSEYPHVELGEVVDILDSLRRPITKCDRKPGPYPYYGATGILDHVAGYLFDEPLVLVGEDGAKWGPGENSAFPVEGKVWVNNHAHVLRPKRDQLMDCFLIEILNEADLLPYVTGVTVPKLNQEKLRSIQIPLPPLEIQQEIVAEIEGYQKVINGARAVLDHYRPHIPIHPDWPMVELGEVCAIKSGGTPSRTNESFWNGDIPWVTTTLIDYGVIDRANEFITAEGLKSSSTWVVPKGTVLMAMYGQGVTRGRVAILGIDAAINQACAAFQIKGKSLAAGFLFSVLRSRYEDLRKISDARGGNQSNLSVQVLKEYSIPLPSLAEQQAIVAEIEAEQALVSANRELITRFEHKIQTVLARIWGETPAVPT